MSQSMSPAAAAEIAKYSNFRVVFFLMMLAAFAFVVALLWNDAIQATVNQLVPDRSNFWIKYLVAFLVTLLLVLIAYGLSRLFLSSWAASTATTTQRVVRVASPAVVAQPQYVSSAGPCQPQVIVQPTAPCAPVRQVPVQQYVEVLDCQRQKPRTVGHPVGCACTYCHQ